MAGTEPADYTPGQTLTAAMMDAISANMRETAWYKATTAGDTFYATAAASLARLAIGATKAIYQVAAGVPVWVALSTALGFQHAYVDADEATSSTSSSYANLTTPGPEITIDVGPSGIALILAKVELYNSGNNISKVGLSIDGANPGDSRSASWQGTPVNTVPLLYVATGLSEASHTFRLKYVVAAGTGNFRRRQIVGFAL